jgi:hypothetical protein
VDSSTVAMLSAVSEAVQEEISKRTVSPRPIQPTTPAPAAPNQVSVAVSLKC